MTDEKDAASTCTWLTTEQAAAALGVSIKTVRRHAKAGTINARKVAGDSGGFVWEIAADATGHPTAQIDSPSDRPDTQATAQATGQSANLSTKPTAQADTRPDKIATDRTPDRTNEVDTASTLEANFTAHLIDENRFLRAALEARDRDAAELRAALRTALAAMPKALTSGSPQVLAADENGPKLEQVGTDPKADGSDPQVLAGASQNEMQGTDGPQTATVNKPAREVKRGAQIGSTARDGRGFRQWLLKVLRG
jgi:excisionase family DNA binding protein